MRHFIIELLKEPPSPSLQLQAGFTGIGVRAAYCSLHPVAPVVEFMTYNFSIQAIDHHIINYVAKSNYIGQNGAASGGNSAIAGRAGVFHVASPVPSGSVPNPEVELIKPALAGTCNVLKTSTEAKIKRVVVVSSVAAVIMNPNWPKGQPMDESCWSVKEFCKTNESSVNASSLFLIKILKGISAHKALLTPLKAIRRRVSCTEMIINTWAFWRNSV
ncbi:hypothetical protein MKX01_041802, partial [Papaver californicum]